MIKKVLVTAAILFACPAFVSAQDIFFSFAQDAVASTADATVADATGSAFIFSAQPFGFNAADLNLSISDPSVISITGGEAFNPVFNTVGGMKFNSTALTGAGPAGRLFSVSVNANGVNPGLATFDPGFNAAVGPAGSILLARVDYDILSAGVTDLSFALGTQGVLLRDGTLGTPSFGDGTLTVTGGAIVPEPTSAMLLILGSVGLVARRRRA